ncbi:hypothetical protein SARC_06295 [Sphaeroforma arctica JP610]|uniref:SAM domain-containing protein n=1 Tax=Sphaeroforma arctica JP610 TaxID=667725 RepID=A0A0L0FWZ7_9EUKA|nr:hypothetical protein SARC_06295 [Sphaeroforma arctica JP610]KNC81370.1 hypothetical protein SARC_06295 [Sphaeroforma arctica JP610]|eukprot:XP_014155272.1 hypothetical protein SARC_06295 [Sphaeroforma arctica JP610]
MDDTSQNMQLVTKSRKKTKTKGCKVPPMSEERINELNELMVTYNPHKNRRDCRVDDLCHPPWAYPAESIDDKTSVEFMFHPDVFKTNSCFRGENCTMRACAFLHPGEYYVPRWRACGAIFDGVFYPPLPITYEWFKFMMIEYKTTGPCMATYTHDHGRCHYYHRDANDRDYFYDLRPPLEYNFDADTWLILPKGATLTARQYHPSTYKIEECRRISNSQKCSKGRYCSFGHLNNEFQRIEEHFRRLAAEFSSQHKESEDGLEPPSTETSNDVPNVDRSQTAEVPVRSFTALIVNDLARPNPTLLQSQPSSGNAWTDIAGRAPVAAISATYISVSNGLEVGGTSINGSVVSVEPVLAVGGSDQGPDTTTAHAGSTMRMGPAERRSSILKQSPGVAASSVMGRNNGTNTLHQLPMRVADQHRSQSSNIIRPQYDQFNPMRMQEQSQFPQAYPQHTHQQQVHASNDDCNTFKYSAYINGGHVRGGPHPGGTGMMPQQSSNQQSHLLQQQQHYQGVQQPQQPHQMTSQAIGVSHHMSNNSINNSIGQRGPFGSFLPPNTHQNSTILGTQSDMKALWHDPVYDPKVEDLGDESSARSAMSGFEGQGQNLHVHGLQQAVLSQHEQQIQQLQRQEHQSHSHQHQSQQISVQNLAHAREHLPDSLTQGFESLNLNSSTGNITRSGHAPSSYAMQHRQPQVMNNSSAFSNFGSSCGGSGGNSGSSMAVYNQGIIHNDGHMGVEGNRYGSVDARAFAEYYQTPTQQPAAASGLAAKSLSSFAPQGTKADWGYSISGGVLPQLPATSRFDATPGAMNVDGSSKSSFSGTLADMSGPNAGAIAQLLMSDDGIISNGVVANTGGVRGEAYYLNEGTALSPTSSEQSRVSPISFGVHDAYKEEGLVNTNNIINISNNASSNTDAGNESSRTIFASSGCRSESVEKVPVSRWSKSEVRDWLAGHDQTILRDLADMLYENDIDGDLLLQLNGENMKTDLNITSLGKRKKLEAAILQIRK